MTDRTRLITKNILNGEFEKVILDWYDGEVNALLHFSGIEQWHLMQLYYFDVNNDEKVYLLFPIPIEISEEYSFKKFVGLQAKDYLEEIKDVYEALKKNIKLRDNMEIFAFSVITNISHVKEVFVLPNRKIDLFDIDKVMELSKKPSYLESLLKDKRKV